MNTTKSLAVVTVVCCAVFGQAATVAASDSGAKVLLIGQHRDHPWGTHMYVHTSHLLANCLRQTEGVETVVSQGWPEDANALRDVDTIVVYSSPAAELLLDGPHRQAVIRHMQQGTGLVTIHWASSVRKQNLDRLGDRWMSFLGGTWVSNVGLSTGTSRLRQLQPDHPVCRGWTEYELRDEFYLNPTISEAAEPLLQVSASGQDVVVGWAYQRPNGGRSYGTTLGHFYSNFQLEAFRRAIVNAILWTAHVEVPPKGAPVALSDEELKLPPQPGLR